MKIIKSATLDSIEATIIDVEATFTKGMPSFTIVGMVSASINESKDRIKSSLLLNNFKFPPLKITINLSPSELNKKVHTLIYQLLYKLLYLMRTK